MNTGYLLMNIAKQLRHSLNQALASFEMTSQQWAVLQQLVMGQGTSQLTASQLAVQLDMDKPTLSGIIGRLTKKGFLTLAPDPNDGRQKILTLTPNGWEKVEVFQNISNQVLNQYLQRLSAAEQNELNQLLNRLNGGN
ncbi:MAG: MarR family transcriptional regulator [Lactobacillus sp.]|jgi:DNA-binding MarR family transcriptional regulator|nr:MarR family transcriptional regulator [Lactobacillus sp.]